MEKLTTNELDSFTIQMLDYNGVIAIIGLLALIFTIFYSFKIGGFREVIENTFLWFLLFGGLFYVASYPVDEDDQITGAIFFLAFGLCRIAKNISRKHW